MARSTASWHLGVEYLVLRRSAVSCSTRSPSASTGAGLPRLWALGGRQDQPPALPEPARRANQWQGAARRVDVRSLDLRKLRRRVGMVFQTPLLFPGDVRANLAYGLSSPDPGRLSAALQDARLPGAFLDRDVDTLSVGEAQRVTIARALVRDPEVLLMDEPTSALDRDAAAGIEALVAHLAGSGLTVVVVTHDLTQACRVAQHAVLLARGRVVACGPPEEVQAAWTQAVAW